MSSNDAVSFGGSYDLSQAEPFSAGVVQWIRKPGEGGRENLACGFWTVGAGELPPAPVEVVIHADETIYLLEGRVRIEVEGGPTHDLTVGSVVSLNAGTKTTWTIAEPMVEFFVYS